MQNDLRAQGQGLRRSPSPHESLKFAATAKIRLFASRSSRGRSWPESSGHYRSMTTSPRGSEQQISRFPSPGASSGSGR